MPLPVIANTVQATLVWDDIDAPRSATTTYHFKDTTGGQTIASLHTAIENATVANMWVVLPTNAHVVRINYTRLDGITAGSSANTAGGAKWAGTGSNDCILQGCCVVSLKSTQRGPRGRNRMFLPWVSEGAQLNGTLTAASVTLMQTAWNTFQTSMATANWPLTAISPLYSDEHLVSSIVVRPFVRTQRRRVRR